MKTIEISKATKPLSYYTKNLKGEIVLLTSHKKPIAAIVSLKRFDKEFIALGIDPEFMRLIEKARAEFKEGKRLSLAEIKKKVSVWK
ncbi:MAG: hypothetical protein HY717_07825 [Planctomycetes bacterium]|nr:hypothetical protein [Planctomycetota bacterium]